MSAKGNLQLCILAPVDAGKTTLTEAILYETGVIKERGRVDKGNAFLDTDAVERTRGITVYSKNARFQTDALSVTLTDTPGHADLTAEAERVLWISDLAILVVNASDGVTDRVRELFHLLSRYRVPVFVFVNKTDLPGTDGSQLLSMLHSAFGEGFVSFDALSDDPDAALPKEDLALLDEALLERYLNGSDVTDADITELIRSRKLFPVFFGAALHGTGVRGLLYGTDRFAPVNSHEQAMSGPFGARVCKIARDPRGTRLTFLRVTGGKLRVRDAVTDGDGTSVKIAQIRLYSGAGYETVREVGAGTSCAVTGPVTSYAGQGLGTEAGSDLDVLTRPMTDCLVRADGVSVFSLYEELRELTEEEPTLCARFTEDRQGLLISLCGRIQAELLRTRMKERYNRDITFAAYDPGGDGLISVSEDDGEASAVTFLTEEEALALRLAEYDSYVAEAEKKALAMAAEAERECTYVKDAPRELTNDEVNAIYEHTYGPLKPRYIPSEAGGARPAGSFDDRGHTDAKGNASSVPSARPPSPDTPHFLLVDGYNVLYANEALKALAAEDLMAARNALTDILINFRGFRTEDVILVFDAYRVPGGTEHTETVHNLTVVYTRQAETADQYIARTAKALRKNYRVTVATSDALEQMIIYGAGATRWSAGDFWAEVAAANEQIAHTAAQKGAPAKGALGNYVVSGSIK